VRQELERRKKDLTRRANHRHNAIVEKFKSPRREIGRGNFSFAFLSALASAFSNRASLGRGVMPAPTFVPPHFQSVVTLGLMHRETR
jgi:hypothetical protein